MQNQDEIFGSDIPSAKLSLLSAVTRFLQAGEGWIYREDRVIVSFANRAYWLMSGIAEATGNRNKVVAYVLMRSLYENLTFFHYLFTNPVGISMYEEISNNRKSPHQAMKEVRVKYSEMDKHFLAFMEHNPELRERFKDTYDFHSRYVHFSDASMSDGITEEISADLTARITFSVSDTDATWSDKARAWCENEATCIWNCTILVLELLRDSRARQRTRDQENLPDEQ